MKQILNFIPLVLFLIFLHFYDIFLAVKVLMISSTVAVIIILLIYKKLDKIELFSYLMVIVFGGLTLLTHDELFIKWKVTVINLIFAIILIGSQYLFKKNILKNILGKEITLNEVYWVKINLIWAIYFIFMALINLYITYQMSDEAFGFFKTFIMTGATLILTVLTSIYIFKHADKLPTDKNTKE